MPTIDVSYSDLCKLIGRRIPIAELKDRTILYAKGEIEEVRGDRLKIDIKDTNRPDLWSAEGVAREIAGRHGKPGMPNYKTKKSGIVMKVDFAKTRKSRPMTACAAVRELRLSEEALSQMIQLQEKVSGTFGRRRRDVAIGVYDLNKIEPPIKYTTMNPDKTEFVPLGFGKKMTLRRILEAHPKGREFGHLLKDQQEYPILIDSASNILSMPPIINSDYTGCVTTKTGDVFIECTGHDLKLMLPALNVMVTALADRGGLIETVEVVYPNKRMTTPNLSAKKIRVNVGDIERVTGLNLSAAKTRQLLEMARYHVRMQGNKIVATYPSYRSDIMHPYDVIEDVLISYGYNSIGPLCPEMSTTGSQSMSGLFSSLVSEIMAGMGFQEIMSYILTNKNHLFSRMNTKEEPVVEIENSVSANWCVFRNRILPGVLEFLSNNKHVDYPQMVFEVGDVVEISSTSETRTKDTRRICAAITGVSAGYEDISSVASALLSALGHTAVFRPSIHPGLIEGRCAGIFAGSREIGVIGEVHPAVLENWNLEKPAAVFEIELEGL